MDYNSNNIDQSLLDAYKDALYTTTNPDFTLKIGTHNEDFTVFLFDNNVYTWTFVSASNPFSINISPEENEKRHLALKSFVENSGLQYLEGVGRSEISDWSEKSILILDISKREAVRLAQNFEQNAIVFGYFNQAPELILCR